MCAICMMKMLMFLGGRSPSVCPRHVARGIASKVGGAGFLQRVRLHWCT